MEETPKYDFSKITKEQRNTITKIESFISEIKYILKSNSYANPQNEKAYSYLYQALLQCTASLLTHWKEKPAKKEIKNGM